MERALQKRLTRRLDLEILLGQVASHPAPKPSLEQYTIPANVAATVLYIAAYLNHDIQDKTVLDLGCGTGRLALGAAFLGATRVVGVDLDKTAAETASDNSRMTGLNGKVDWINADLDAVRGCFDTTLQNPPFGVQTRGADRRFLDKAVKASKKVYSLHNSLHRDRHVVKKLKAEPNGFASSIPSSFLKRYIESQGARIAAVYSMLMSIPHMFTFHAKRRHEFVVDLYVIETLL